MVIESLGNASLSFLASAGVHSIRNSNVPADATAHMEICLIEDTWEKRARAIHSMVELREMFMDDVSLEYHFVTPEECGATADTEVEVREFALA